MVGFRPRVGWIGVAALLPSPPAGTFGGLLECLIEGLPPGFVRSGNSIGVQPLGSVALGAVVVTSYENFEPLTARTTDGWVIHIVEVKVEAILADLFIHHRLRLSSRRRPLVIRHRDEVNAYLGVWRECRRRIAADRVLFAGSPARVLPKPVHRCIPPRGLSQPHRPATALIRYRPGCLTSLWQPGLASPDPRQSLQSLHVQPFSLHAVVGQGGRVVHRPNVAEREFGGAAG